MTADLRVLHYQKIIPGHEYDYLRKQEGDVFDRYIRGDMRQHIAAELVKGALYRETLAEPDPASDDPLRQQNAVIRMSVAVASADDAGALARDLTEAEERGFRDALAAVKAAMAKTLALSNGSREASFANAVLGGILVHVQGERDHAPAAGWRPMRTAPPARLGIEYLFVNGGTARQPRLFVPRKPDLTPQFEQTTAVSDVAGEWLEAIAWRHADRPPHTERAA